MKEPGDPTCLGLASDELEGPLEDALRWLAGA